MAREALLINGAAANFFTFRLQNKAFFATVYNILASFSDLTNSPVQYSIDVEKGLY